MDGKALLCAFAGILVSYLPGDVPARVLLLGTLSSAVTGVVGAATLHYLR
jgi:TRAP-type mannitol/chloroaromatic compound transport system permease large subunit